MYEPLRPFGDQATRIGRTALYSRNPRRRQRHQLAIYMAFYVMLGAFRQCPESGAGVLAEAVYGPGSSRRERGYQQGLPRSSLGKDDGNNLSAIQMAEWLGEIEVHVMVDVVLVGFREIGGGGGGGGENFVSLNAVVLQQHLDELVRGLSTDGKGGVPITLVRG